MRKCEKQIAASGTKITAGNGDSGKKKKKPSGKMSQTSNKLEKPLVEDVVYRWEAAWHSYRTTRTKKHKVTGDT